MAPRTKKSRPTPSFKTKLKKDPAGAIKGQVEKTGWGKYIIGATLLGVVGGSAMVPAVRRIPVVGGILGVMTSKGARLISGMKK